MKTIITEPPPTQRKQTSKLAIASLVLGILSPLIFFFFPTNFGMPLIYRSLFAVPSIIALIFGIIAINKINKSSNLKGVNLVIVGLILASPQIMFGIGVVIMVIIHSEF